MMGMFLFIYVLFRVFQPKFSVMVFQCWLDPPRGGLGSSCLVLVPGAVSCLFGGTVSEMFGVVGVVVGHVHSPVVGVDYCGGGVLPGCAFRGEHLGICVGVFL